MMERLTSVAGGKTWRDGLTRLFGKPVAAGAIAAVMLALAAIFTIQGDQLNRAEKVRQATVQAQIFASSIAAPLAFNDEATLREYLEALHADPQILAVGVYDSQSRLVTGYRAPPGHLSGEDGHTAATASSRELAVTAAVRQGGAQLGSVYLRVSMDSWPKRILRYAGLALLVLTAALLITALGRSYASLNEAHRQLQVETANRLQAEEALRHAQKMEALGQLTGGVAHDFNNLLMVASGSLELMARTQDPAKHERLRAAIGQAVARGAELTQQLLSFSRRSPEKVEVVDLSERAGGMHALLDQLASNRISLAISIDRDVWPVEVDPSELEVALLNLIINARDAMPDGGKIIVSARNVEGPGDAQTVRIDVSDQGSGIPPEIVERVFDPFFTTKAPGRGTGLGLSQVYGFARASGGTATVASGIGEGTTVSLLLPRSKKQPIRPTPANAVVEAKNNRHILLVEDNDTVAEMVGTMLKEIGYEVERAESADLALSRLERGVDFALVVSDMVMPGARNGLDLVHEISRRWPKLPYVLMTGYSESSATARSEGIPLIVKPFSMEKLSAVVSERLSE